LYSAVLFDNEITPRLSGSPEREQYFLASYYNSVSQESTRTGVPPMTIKLVKVLVTTVSLAALVLGTTPSMARWGGGGGGGGHFAGGHFGGGGGHFGGGRFGGGGGHWGGGARFGAAHFSGARIGMSRSGAAQFRSSQFRSFSGTRTALSRSNFARVNAAHIHGLGAGALGGRAAWNHGAWNHGAWNHGAWNQWGNNWRGGWNRGCCGGWWGPVFWPFFAGDLLAFTFWPWGFFDPFWAYGNMFVWDAMFWPGPQYSYGPYDDVYGGYAYGGPNRPQRCSRNDWLD
jgi:hypothetical protein